MEHDDRELLKDIEESVGKLDGIEPAVPEFMYFKKLVEREQCRQKRSQRRQLALFITVAAVLVSGLILAMGRFEVILFALQGAALAVAAISLIVAFARKPRERLQQ